LGKQKKMKIILTGSLGNIGKPLTEQLLEKGHSVTVVSSKPEKHSVIEALGAKAAIGSIEDTSFIIAAFKGADAVYTMVPPHDFFDPGLDLYAYVQRITHNYVRAIQEANVKRVVHLSSIGADLEKNSGFILSHHAAEAILNKLSDVAITFMRPTAFYYNLLAFLPVIKSTGNIISNYGEEDIVPWVSPVDIAWAVAEEITARLIGRKVRYVASEELSCNEIAGILGRAIEKPDMKWIRIPDEQMSKNLEAVGMPPSIAKGFVEMNAAIHSGALSKDYFRNRPKEMGKVKMTDFAKDFAFAFNQK
jgi:uncharacterized protein YbjT (DUF2867 family)